MNADGEIPSTSMRYDVFAQFQQEAPEINWTTEGGNEPTYEYVLFSRNGFASSLKEARDDLRLYAVQNIVERITE